MIRTLLRLSVASAAMLAVTTLVAEAQERTVNVYNWSDYIDESIISSDGPKPSGDTGHGATSSKMKSCKTSPLGPSSATRSPPLLRFAVAYPVGTRLMPAPYAN